MTNQGNSRGPFPFSEQQIITILREIRFTPAIDRISRRSVGLRTIACEAGLATMTLYRILNGTALTWPTRRRIGQAITRLQQQGAFPTLSPPRDGAPVERDERPLRTEFKRFR